MGNALPVAVTKQNDLADTKRCPFVHDELETQANAT